MPRSRDPQRRALRSSEADLDRAAEVTPDDLTALAETAPASVRKYLRARPMEEEDEDGEEGR
jgi:hypothetical protein